MNSGLDLSRPNRLRARWLFPRQSWIEVWFFFKSDQCLCRYDGIISRHRSCCAIKFVTPVDFHWLDFLQFWTCEFGTRWCFLSYMNAFSRISISIWLICTRRRTHDRHGIYVLDDVRLPPLITGCFCSESHICLISYSKKNNWSIWGKFSVSQFATRFFSSWEIVLVRTNCKNDPHNSGFSISIAFKSCPYNMVMAAWKHLEFVLYLKTSSSNTMYCRGLKEIYLNDS